MSKFWDKFDEMFGKMDEMFDALPEYIEEKMDRAETKLDKKRSLFRSTSISTSTTIQNGKKVEVTTVNGKTTVKVNGKEYVEKK